MLPWVRVDEVGVLKPLTCAARRAGEAVMADAGWVEPDVVEEAEEVVARIWMERSGRVQDYW